jgi:hypothetical protein
VTERTLELPSKVTDESVSPGAACAIGLEMSAKRGMERAIIAPIATLLFM